MSAEPITLRVSGRPAPQGSKTGFIVTPKGGKPRVVITEGKRGSPQRKNLDAWLDAIEAAAASLPARPLLEGPVRLRVIFYMPRPVSYPKWRWLAWQKPDVDKLCRSTMDGLTAAQIYKDDAQVVELAARKIYALDGHPTGALIRIEPLAEMEHERGSAWLLGGGPPPTL